MLARTAAHLRRCHRPWRGCCALTPQIRDTGLSGRCNASGSAARSSTTANGGGNGPPSSSGGVDVGGGDDRHHHGEFRTEALQLYRDTLRMARGFPLSDPSDGVPWRVKLAKSARSEFEANRSVTDKYEVSRLILGGQSALDEMAKKLQLPGVPPAD